MQIYYEGRTSPFLTHVFWGCWPANFWTTTTTGTGRFYNEITGQKMNTSLLLLLMLLLLLLLLCSTLKNWNSKVRCVTLMTLFTQEREKIRFNYFLRKQFWFCYCNTLTGWVMSRSMIHSSTFRTHTHILLQIHHKFYLRYFCTMFYHRLK